MLLRSRHVSLWLIWVLIATLVLAACGGGNAQNNTTGTNSKTPTPNLSAPIGGTTPTTGAAGGATAGPGGEATGGTEATAGTTGSTPAAEGTSAGGAGGSNQAATCPTSTKGLSVTMWSPFSGPDGKYMSALASKFNSDKQGNPTGIKVSHLPNGDYLTKLNTSAAAHKLPEMTAIREGDIATEAARHILQPMSPEVLKLIGGDQKDFPSAVWNLAMYKSQRYGYPLDIHPLVMFYNKDLFKKAGLSGPPKSKAEIEADAAKLKQGDTIGWSLTSGVFPSAFIFLTLLHQYGGSAFNEDGTQVTWNSPAGVKALSYLKEAKDKYAKPNMQQDEGVTAFKQGKSAIEMNGIWQTTDLINNLKFGAGAPVPKVGDKYAVWGGSHQLALTTTDPAKQAAAACWIGWLSKNSALWARGGQIPARISVRKSPEFKSLSVAVFAPEAEAVFFDPTVPGLGDAYAELDQARDAVLTGKATDVKKALDDAAQKGDKILKANAQRYK